MTADAGPSKRPRGELEPPPNSFEAGSNEASNDAEDVETAAAAAAAATAALDLEDLVGGDADIAFEQELRRDPYQLKIWLAYLKSRAKAKPATRFVIYERALRSLPGSYKLWRLYLLERVALCEASGLLQSASDDPLVAAANSAFERCLLHLSRMPEIWRFFLNFLQQQRQLTRCRRTFDAALRALAVTQHELLWPGMMEYVKSCGVPETAVCLYRRWVMLEPEKGDEFALYLSSIGRYDEAASQLAALASDPSITPASGRSRHELWLELCKLVAAHPEAIHSMRVEDILRSGISRFSDAVSSLWCSLASHYVRVGLLAKARDIYEEAVSSVSTIRDLALVYEAYAAFEEAVVAQLLQQQQQRPATAAAARELDFAIARLERLTERRPLLISSCKLRQNPHNVHEWLARAELLQDDPKKVVDTFSEAVASVDAEHAVGRVGVLWIAFARFYEAHGDLENAAKVFERGVQAAYRTIEDLASVWCEAVEMHLRHGMHQQALLLVRQAISKPKNKETKGAQTRLFRSVKLWALAADVEEMFGSMETVRACYDKMFQLKVITPQLVINYAHYLEERGYYEESFRAYERGVAAFHWPHVNAIWLMYLTKFVSRYRSTKLERARELFQQATAEVPPKYAKNIFLLYAKLEETYGLAKHALAIYSAATKAVLPEEQLDMFNVYIAKTSELFGVARTRKIFEEAIESLPSKDVRRLLAEFTGCTDTPALQVRSVCMRYAVVEKSLGEIDRSRAIYQHAAHLCDPSRDEEFWNAWRDLEVAYGNEDTFKDMLRIKRSVMAQYSQVHHNVAELTASEVPKPPPADPMKEAAAQLEREDALRQQVLRQEEALQEQLRFHEKQQAELNELQEAEAEYEELQRKRRKAATLANLPETAPMFISAKTFIGLRLGYAFKQGPQGLGYYLDEAQVGKEFVQSREKAFLEAARAGTSSSRTSSSTGNQQAASRGQRQEEEMDIDVDSVQLEEKKVPDTVFGSLKKK